jgi:hypothetical protein
MGPWPTGTVFDAMALCRPAMETMLLPQAMNPSPHPPEAAASFANLLAKGCIRIVMIQNRRFCAVGEGH